MPAVDHPAVAMAKPESIVVGSILGIVCPATLFVACWWTAAALSICDLLPVSTGVIIAAAFAGLGLGLILDVLFLKRWVLAVYLVERKALIPAYLVWSVMAVGLCMGLPVGTASLGAMAGVYTGRRLRHARSSGETLRLEARKVGLFAAAVTGLGALPIGLLALQSEARLVEAALEVVGLSHPDMAGLGGVALVAVLCLVLMVAQYWVTRAAARLAFGLAVPRSASE